jgi:osmoprotectant transport system ATP-binding protein
LLFRQHIYVSNTLFLLRSEIMIRIENLCKSYGDNKVLKDINLHIEKGELVSLIGPSGCGKTTLLRCINRLNDITSGKIYIDGKDSDSIDPVHLRRGIGYVIQQIGLFPHMTIRKNINIVPKLIGMEMDQAYIDRINELMHLVSLDPDVFLDRYPAQLSGGQQQRIGVIRGLAANPPILLMDEPFSALDPISREQLQDELLNIQSTMKKTIVFVTHDMDEAIKMSDRIAFMYQGKIQQFDSPHEILENPANDFIKGFIGEERRNKNLGVAATIMVGDIARSYDNLVYGDACVGELFNSAVLTKNDNLVVTDRNDNLLGMVSSDEIKNCPDANTKLQQLAHKVPHLEYDLNIQMANSRMNELDISEMPVVDGTKALGSVSYKTILRTIAR